MKLREELEMELERLNSEYIYLEKELEDLEIEKESLEDEIDNLENEMNDLEEKLENLDDEDDEEEDYIDTNWLNQSEGLFDDFDEIEECKSNVIEFRKA